VSEPPPSFSSAEQDLESTDGHDATPDAERVMLAELETDTLSKAQRRELVRELREVATDRSIGVLRTSLRSDDLKTQVAAVLALRSIASDHAASALIDCLSMETGTRFTFALWALAGSHAAQARGAFVETLAARSRELDQGDKRLIIKGLARAPHRSEVPVLSMLLCERSSRTRRMAAEALALIRAPEAVEALEDSAHSSPWLRGRQARHGVRVARRIDAR
jgi:HEAT repeat protein